MIDEHTTFMDIVDRLRARKWWLIVIGVVLLIGLFAGVVL